MNSFKILSLDGGGIRGAFTASFLATIEGQVEHQASACFDLYAGTSTGGIVATALAAGMPASKLVEFYRDRGPAIFTKHQPSLAIWQRLALRIARRKSPGIADVGLFHTKYDGTALRQALDDVFGKQKLGDLDRRLLLPSVNLVKGQTKVFKTPHLSDYFHDKTVTLTDAVMATTAAPTYFPAAVHDAGSAYCDGGVWANNPAIVAYAEACRMAKAAKQPQGDGPVPPHIDLDAITMLSIGTGSRTYSFDPPGNEAGLIAWNTRLIEVPGNSQAQGAAFQANYLMDDRVKRIDFELPNPAWQLDAVDAIDSLIHLGREVAAEQLRHGVENFFTATASPYNTVARSSHWQVRATS